MDENDQRGTVAVVIFLFGLVVGASCGYGGGTHKAAEKEQSKAIEAGAGHWIINEKTGERVFVYGTGGK
jgi:hypothetical protein